MYLIIYIYTTYYWTLYSVNVIYRIYDDETGLVEAKLQTLKQSRKGACLSVFMELSSVCDGITRNYSANLFPSPGTS